MDKEVETAMRQAMSYLGLRARTVSQMEQYLQKKQYTERTIAVVMEKLIDYKLLDDEQYARRYIEMRKSSSGKYLLKQKMRQQGLESDTIEMAIEEIPFEEQVEAAHALLEKKLANDDRPDALRRAVQSVMRRGFSYDAVRAAADQYKEELTWDE